MHRALICLLTISTYSYAITDMELNKLDSIPDHIYADIQITSNNFHLKDKTVQGDLSTSNQSTRLTLDNSKVNNIQLGNGHNELELILPVEVGEIDSGIGNLSLNLISGKENKFSQNANYININQITLGNNIEFVIQKHISEGTSITANRNNKIVINPRSNANINSPITFSAGENSLHYHAGNLNALIDGGSDGNSGSGHGSPVTTTVYVYKDLPSTSNLRNINSIVFKADNYLGNNINIDSDLNYANLVLDNAVNGLHNNIKLAHNSNIGDITLAKQQATGAHYHIITTGYNVIKNIHTNKDAILTVNGNLEVGNLQLGKTFLNPQAQITINGEINSTFYVDTKSTINLSHNDNDPDAKLPEELNLTVINQKTDVPHIMANQENSLAINRENVSLTGELTALSSIKLEAKNKEFTLKQNFYTYLEDTQTEDNSVRKININPHITISTLLLSHNFCLTIDGHVRNLLSYNGGNIIVNGSLHNIITNYGENIIKLTQTTVAPTLIPAITNQGTANNLVEITGLAYAAKEVQAAIYVLKNGSLELTDENKVNGNVVVDGTLNIFGSPSINGDLELTKDSNINFLNHNAANLAVSGNARLNGNLKIRLTGDFSKEGKRITLITAKDIQDNLNFVLSTNYRDTVKKFVENNKLILEIRRLSMSDIFHSDLIAETSMAKHIDYLERNNTLPSGLANSLAIVEDATDKDSYILRTKALIHALYASINPTGNFKAQSYMQEHLSERINQINLLHSGFKHFALPKNNVWHKSYANSIYSSQLTMLLNGANLGYETFLGNHTSNRYSLMGATASAYKLTSKDKVDDLQGGSLNKSLQVYAVYNLDSITALATTGTVISQHSYQYELGNLPLTNQYNYNSQLINLGFGLYFDLRFNQKSMLTTNINVYYNYLRQDSFTDSLGRRMQTYYLHQLNFVPELSFSYKQQSRYLLLYHLVVQANLSLFPNIPKPQYSIVDKLFDYDTKLNQGIELKVKAIANWKITDNVNLLLQAAIKGEPHKPDNLSYDFGIKFSYAWA